MSNANIASLISAVFGAAGAIVLFNGSYALQPFEGGVFGSDALTAYNDQVKRKNARRVVIQKVGLGLICIGFLIQGLAAFL